MECLIMFGVLRAPEALLFRWSIHNRDRRQERWGHPKSRLCMVTLVISTLTGIKCICVNHPRGRAEDGGRQGELEPQAHPRRYQWEYVKSKVCSELRRKSVPTAEPERQGSCSLRIC